jgi:hypothetical protein
MDMKRSRYQLYLMSFALAVASGVQGPASAAVIYSNDFESNTNGFDITQRIVLPRDTMGGTSTYLGNRTPGTRSATLTLTGLTPGETYDFAVDVLIGGTWDGSLVFGPDFFFLSTSSAGSLVNATFRNGQLGNPTPSQTYSDATPLGNGGLFRTREGSDVELGEAIYYFGRGVGNPAMAFTATATTETIHFASQDFQGITDEFFALDNVVVTDRGTLGIESRSWSAVRSLYR